MPTVISLSEANWCAISDIATTFKRGDRDLSKNVFAFSDWSSGTNRVNLVVVVVSCSSPVYDSFVISRAELNKGSNSC